MGEILVRRLSIEDYDVMIELWRKAGLRVKPKGRDSRRKMEAQMQTNPEFFVGAFDEQRLVGLVFGSWDGRKGWINRLAVDPMYRRKGIGKRLVEVVEETLEKMGIAVFSVLIEKENEQSLSLFKSRGYSIHKNILYLSKRKNKDV